MDVSLIGRYLSYLISGKSKFYIHSPFIYEFVMEVINDKRHYYDFDRIESMRLKLLDFKKEVEVLDLGAGSHGSNASTRKVSDICKLAACSPKNGRLLFSICQKYKPRNILELGTSLGIGTAYLATARKSAQVYTIEGAPAIAGLARTNLKHLGLQNIHSYIGSFSDVLPTVLNDMGQVDLAYIDGHHDEEATIAYFNRIKPFLHSDSIVIFDDINWSNGMYAAWQAIEADPDVIIALNLFRLGVVFFKEDVAKQAMKLYY